MAILSVYHPDVTKFIESKRDGASLSNFNISIGVDRKFMDMVAAGDDYETINPRTELPAGTLNAKGVFELIVQCAWETGDPGLVFLDRINDDNPNPQLGRIESTNPCVAGDTVVATSEGPKTARQLVGSPFIALVNGEEWPSTAEGFFHTGRREVIEITTEGDHRIRVTADHRLRLRSDGGDEWREAGLLRPGDRLVLDSGTASDGGSRRRLMQTTADARGTAVRGARAHQYDALSRRHHREDRAGRSDRYL